MFIRIHAWLSLSLSHVYHQCYHTHHSLTHSPQHNNNNPTKTNSFQVFGGALGEPETSPHPSSLEASFLLLPPKLRPLAQTASAAADALVRRNAGWMGRVLGVAGAGWDDVKAWWDEL